MGAPAQQREYEWESATIGDSAAPYSMEVTEDGVAEYCRAARYENPVYTSLAAAKEAGYLGSVTPPAMLLALAPVQLDGVAAAAGCVLPVMMDPAATPTPTASLPSSSADPWWRPETWSPVLLRWRISFKTKMANSSPSGWWPTTSEASRL